ncbi:hypothetical protein [Paraburkholderia sp. RL17-381-BIF-C]|jgi:hypothetical protein
MSNTLESAARLAERGTIENGANEENAGEARIKRRTRDCIVIRPKKQIHL